MEGGIRYLLKNDNGETYCTMLSTVCTSLFSTSNSYTIFSHIVLVDCVGGAHTQSEVLQQVERYFWFRGVERSVGGAKSQR